MHRYTFTAEIERDIESGFYVGRVPALPGAHTQAQSLDQLHVNLKEVIELCLESLTQQELACLPEFVGFQQIMVER
jgi:predicted RNase H-like HicB family nuclease